MLIFYDESGKIITENTVKSTIQGSLSCIEVTAPEGKEVYKIDVEHNNTPIFVNTVEQDLIETQVKISRLLPTLAKNDIKHDRLIKEINDALKALKTDLDGVIADIKTLKGGE